MLVLQHKPCGHAGLLVTRQVGLAVVLALPAPIRRLGFSDVKKDGMFEFFRAIHHEIDGSPLDGDCWASARSSKVRALAAEAGS